MLCGALTPIKLEQGQEPGVWRSLSDTRKILIKRTLSDGGAWQTVRNHGNRMQALRHSASRTEHDLLRNSQRALELQRAYGTEACSNVLRKKTGRTSLQRDAASSFELLRCSMPPAPQRRMEQIRAWSILHIIHRSWADRRFTCSMSNQSSDWMIWTSVYNVLRQRSLRKQLIKRNTGSLTLRHLTEFRCAAN